MSEAAPDPRKTRRFRCPSAAPEDGDAELLGIVLGTPESPRMQFVGPRAVTPELLALAGPVRPTEVFRFVGTCLDNGCAHFREGHCGVAAAVVAHLPAVEGASLPRCGIRSDCRWWHEQGADACRRCPSVVTDDGVRTGPYREAVLSSRD